MHPPCNAAATLRRASCRCGRYTRRTSAPGVQVAWLVVHGFRVLLTPRWLGIAAAALAAAAIMVALGFWQLSRYHERSAINAGIDAAAAADPTPVDRWLRPGQP